MTKVQVTDTSQPLEATLVWSDRPGTDPQHAITNNLNLVVTSPASVVYRGNCFQGRNHLSKIVPIDLDTTPAKFLEYATQVDTRPGVASIPARPP